MKRYNILQIILPIVLLALSAGCVEDPDKIRNEKYFSGLTGMGIYSESADVYKYDESKAQYAVSAKYNTTRIQNDDKTKFIRIVMDDAPSIGETVAASVTSYGIPGVGANDKTLTAIKMEDGKVWLMDDKAKVCFIMPWGN